MSPVQSVPVASPYLTISVFQIFCGLLVVVGGGIIAFVLRGLRKNSDCIESAVEEAGRQYTLLNAEVGSIQVDLDVVKKQGPEIVALKTDVSWVRESLERIEKTVEKIQNGLNK